MIWRSQRYRQRERRAWHAAQRREGAIMAAIVELERECGLVRAPCPWCAPHGNSAECIACNGRSYFLREVDDDGRNTQTEA